MASHACTLVTACSNVKLAIKVTRGLKNGWYARILKTLAYSTSSTYNAAHPLEYAMVDVTGSHTGSVLNGFQMNNKVVFIPKQGL